MNRQEYKKLQHELDTLILKFQVENDIEDKLLLKMLLDNANSCTVRFDEDGQLM